MCWNGQASTALATVGLVGAGYVSVKGEDAKLWLPLGYFALMEALQAVTYSVIDQCDAPLNQILTLLSYLHIAFQPFFINAFALYFIPKSVSERISPWVYGTCFIGTIMVLVRLYPFTSIGMCDPKTMELCSEHLCSVSGSWHLAWGLPLNNMKWLSNGYLIPAFIIPVIYGSWKFLIYQSVFGPILASFLTNDMNEHLAIWCLLSIAFLLAATLNPVKESLYCRNWWLWDVLQLPAGDTSLDGEPVECNVSESILSTETDS
ncbi:MAG: DUF5765 domain-containing protein [Spirulinaceae cyanobacterium]